MVRSRERAAQVPPVSTDLQTLILESITEGVFTVDAEFRITSFNAEAERIIGVSRRDAIGRRCHEVFRASICSSTCALRQTVKDGSPRRNVRIDVLNPRMEPVPICVSTAVLKDRRGHLIGGVEIFRDVSEVESLRRELSGDRVFADMVGASKPMQELFALLPDLAASDAPVLIQGPSGSGKELVARALHDLSPRAKRPLVLVNCAALPDTLLESELFGHLRGAFTDARENRVGRFQSAHKGVLFLDEIGEISPAFQAKLLRVLESGELSPLGSDRVQQVDVRVISATNRDLQEQVRCGRFREDLFYRLRVIPITLPPLSDRRSDIPLLVDHLVAKLRLRTGKPIQRLSSEAIAVLYEYDFPGNVRELQNLLERAFVLCHGAVIERDHLPREVLATSRAGAKRLKPSEHKIASHRSPAKGSRLQDPEAQLIAALEAHRWNRTETARALGIGRNTLWRRMREHGLR